MLKIKEIVKNFGGVRALRNVSFQVQKGEFVGLIGPNGSGKTTTVKVLTTILALTAGAARVAGFDVS